jgi:hypothetical protein
MAKKTVLRRMSKRWDLNAEVHEAIQTDDIPITGMKPAVIATPVFLPEPPDKPSESPPEASEPPPPPEQPATVDVAPEAPQEPKASLQDQLSALVGDAGYTFDDFVARIAGKLNTNASSWADFNEVPDDVCKTVLRAKKVAIERLKGNV